MVIYQGSPSSGRAGHPHPSVAQGPHEVGIVGGSIGLKAVVIAEFPTNDLPLNDDLGDFTFFHGRKKIAEDNFRFSRLLAIEQVKHEQEDHPENQPQCEIRRNLVHSVTFPISCPVLAYHSSSSTGNGLTCMR